MHGIPFRISPALCTGVLLAAGLAAEPAGAVSLLEDYEPLTAPQAGTMLVSGDTYYGLFDDGTTPSGLRVTWGEGLASGASAVSESGNTFVRASIDPTAGGAAGFLGILDHPAVEPFGHTLVGDYAALFEQPVFVGGADFSVDIRVPDALPGGFSLSVRWLFTDPSDDEELVTALFPIIADGAFHTVSLTDLDLSALISLGGDGGPVDGVLEDGVTTFPVALEIFGVGGPGPSSAFAVDIDNFAMNDVRPVPEPPTMLLGLLAGTLLLARRGRAR